MQMNTFLMKKLCQLYLSIHTYFNGALLTAYLFLLTPKATARKRNELTRGTSTELVDSELVKGLIDCAGK